MLTLILYPPGNQTQIVIAAPNNEVSTEFQLSIGYQLQLSRSYPRQTQVVTATIANAFATDLQL